MRHLMREKIAVTGAAAATTSRAPILAGLARKQKGRLATLDTGLAALHEDVAELIPFH